MFPGFFCIKSFKIRRKQWRETVKALDTYLLLEYIYKTERRRRSFRSRSSGLRPENGPRQKLSAPCSCFVNILEEYQVHSHDFVQERANPAPAQDIPYQKSKTPRIWPTIFGSEPIHFLFSYFYYKTLFYFSAQGGQGPLAQLPPPLATSLKSMRLILLRFLFIAMSLKKALCHRKPWNLNIWAFVKAQYLIDAHTGESRERRQRWVRGPDPFLASYLKYSCFNVIAWRMKKTNGCRFLIRQF